VAEFVANVTRPGVGLHQLRPKSNNVCLWQCQRCPHRWQAQVNSRTRPSGCRRCADAVNTARRTTPEAGRGSAGERLPHLRQEFLANLTRPGQGPDEVYPHATDRCRWSCPAGCPPYETSIASRTTGSGCPRCGRRRTGAALRAPKPGRSLARTHPQIAEQWVQILSTPGCGPDGLSAGSSDRCVWSCRHGHVWQATVDSRARIGNGCPRCSTAGQSRLELEVAELLRASTGAVVRTAMRFDVGRRRHLVEAGMVEGDVVEVQARTWTVDLVIDLPDDSVLLIDLDPVSTHSDSNHDTHRNLRGAWLRDLRKAVAFAGEGYLRLRAATLPPLPAPAVMVDVDAPTGRTPAWTWVQALTATLAEVDLAVTPLTAGEIREALAAAGRQWVVRKGGAPTPSALDVRPDLAAEFLANLDRPGLGLDLLAPTSDNVCSWRCTAHQSTWSASVKSRVGRRAGFSGRGSIDAARRGSRCPICIHQETTARSRAGALPGPGQSLAERYPLLAAQFRGCLARPELSPQTLRCTSTYLCLWWCPTCKSEYPSTPARRTSGKSCRACGRRRADLTRRTPAPGQSLAERFPHLAAEFVSCPSRPGDGPAQIAAAANVAINWRCSQDGYEWSAPANDRASGQGCPRCGRQRTAAARARPAPGRSLAEALPDIAAQWVTNQTHPGRGPDQLNLGSRDRCLWRCPQGHPDWPAVVSSRSRGSGCPTCGRQQAARTCHRQDQRDAERTPSRR